MNRTKTCKEAFWTLVAEPGWTTPEFMHWKDGDASGCYITTLDPMDAEKFGSYRELRDAMKNDGDVSEFMQDFPNATPAKVAVKTTVSWRN